MKKGGKGLKQISFVRINQSSQNSKGRGQKEEEEEEKHFEEQQNVEEIFLQIMFTQNCSMFSCDGLLHF